MVIVPANVGGQLFYKISSNQRSAASPSFYVITSTARLYLIELFNLLTTRQTKMSL